MIENKSEPSNSPYGFAAAAKLKVIRNVRGGNEMMITDKERRLIAFERSYRVERAECGAFAFLSAVPFILAALLFGGNWWTCPSGHQDIFWNMMATFDWSRLCPAALIFMVLFFLAYRAHSKLVLIGHLKQHLNESESKMK